MRGYHNWLVGWLAGLPDMGVPDPDWSSFSLFGLSSFLGVTTWEGISGSTFMGELWLAAKPAMRPFNMSFPLATAPAKPFPMPMEGASTTAEYTCGI